MMTYFYFQMIAKTIFGLFMFVASILPSIFTYTHPSTDSIMDIINREEVNRLIAENKENNSRENRRYLIDNELIDNYIPPDSEYEINRKHILDNESPEVYGKSDNPRIDINVLYRRNNFSKPFRGTELLNDLRGYDGRKLLKSSKNALLVTKKEYLQRDWCKTEPLVQKIREEGCKTRTIINRFCYGQCNSFYIPKNPKRRNRHRLVVEETEDEDLNGPSFKSCSFCKPKKFTWITVMLECPDLETKIRKKRIQRIKQCKCVAVDVN